MADGALWWPDYPGNNMFTSFGNLAVDDTAAVLVPDFGTGTSLQLSGRAAVEWVSPGSVDDHGGTGRRVRFTVQQVASGALAVREEPTDPSWHRRVSEGLGKAPAQHRWTRTKRTGR